MSSILLTNPFLTPPAPGAAQELSPTVTIPPAQDVTSARTSNDASAFSGSAKGSGASRQGETVALISQHKRQQTQPSDATPGSVINAQGQTGTPVVMPGANLPRVEMPDPLPTSPFLKNAARTQGQSLLIS